MSMFDFDDIYKEAAAKYNKCVFIEIGVWTGESTSCLLHAIRNNEKHILLLCMDNFEGANVSSPHWNKMKQEWKTDNQREAFNKRLSTTAFKENHHYLVMEGNSHDSLDTLLDYRKNNICFILRETGDQVLLADVEINFIYIDGDHSYKGCLGDMERAWQLLAEGGTMAGHDAHDPAVRRAVNDFASKHSVNVNHRRNSWVIYK